jgi:hypothetical protein
VAVRYLSIREAVKRHGAVFGIFVRVQMISPLRSWVPKVDALHWWRWLINYSYTVILLSIYRGR